MKGDDKGQDIKLGRWLKEEDQMLLDQIQNDVFTSWGNIHIPGRSSKQKRIRWESNLDPAINRSKWTEEENQLLLNLQEKYGNKWTVIANEIAGRNVHQIKPRFLSLLAAKEKKEKKNWSIEDDAVTIESKLGYNSRWSTISKRVLKNRSMRKIRERWKEVQAMIEKHPQYDSFCKIYEKRPKRKDFVISPESRELAKFCSVRILETESSNDIDTKTDSVLSKSKAANIVSGARGHNITKKENISIENDRRSVIGENSSSSSSRNINNNKGNKNIINSYNNDKNRKKGTNNNNNSNSKKNKINKKNMKKISNSNSNKNSYSHSHSHSRSHSNNNSNSSTTINNNNKKSSSSTSTSNNNMYNNKKKKSSSSTGSSGRINNNKYPKKRKLNSQNHKKRPSETSIGLSTVSPDSSFGVLQTKGSNTCDSQAISKPWVHNHMVPPQQIPISVPMQMMSNIASSPGYVPPFNTQLIPAGYPRDEMATQTHMHAPQPTFPVQLPVPVQVQMQVPVQPYSILQPLQHPNYPATNPMRLPNTFYHQSYPGYVSMPTYQPSSSLGIPERVEYPQGTNSDFPHK